MLVASLSSPSSRSTGSGSGQYNDTYSYDAVGNLINHDGTYLGYGGPNPGIQNGARPHLVTHFSGNPTPRYVYDANGNMTSRNDGTTTWTQTWTPENMLQQATAGTTSVTMIHDGDNQLMRRVENVNGVVTTIIYLGKLLENTVTPGNTYKKYYLFNGKPVAMREGLSSGSLSYFVTDHLGSINTTLWANGSVRSDLRYYPFGKERWFVDVTPTGTRFTGQRWDSKLGLYDYNARFYDPQIGRFISADTLVPHFSNPQSLNRYTYVLNNPIKLIDPTGHMDWPGEGEGGGSTPSGTTGGDDDSPPATNSAPSEASTASEILASVLIEDFNDSVWTFIFSIVIEPGSDEWNMLIAELEWWIDFFTFCDAVGDAEGVASFIGGLLSKGFKSPIPGGAVLAMMSSGWSASDLSTLLDALLTTTGEVELTLYYSIYDPRGALPAHPIGWQVHLNAVPVIGQSFHETSYPDVIEPLKVTGSAAPQIILGWYYWYTDAPSPIVVPGLMGVQGFPPIIQFGSRGFN